LKRFRKRLASKRKNQRVHKNGQTAWYKISGCSFFAYCFWTIYVFNSL
jgi:hypothetical protein